MGRGSVSSLAPPPPASSIFLLWLQFARGQKGGKALRTGTLATQASDSQGTPGGGTWMATDFISCKLQFMAGDCDEGEGRDGSLMGRSTGQGLVTGYDCGLTAGTKRSK